jgi:3-oxoacyl-[acyl-carrier-protein] synthase II
MIDRSRPVFVTGIGIVGPTGVDIDSFWSALISGPPAIRSIDRFDVSAFPIRVAAQVDDNAILHDDIPLQKWRNIPRVSRLALGAARLALADARLDIPYREPRRCGVVIGTSLGGWHDAQEQFAVLLERGAGRVNPFLVSGSANHAIAAEVSQLACARGHHATFSTGCCGSTHAIGYAAELIASGRLDVCLTGGAEAPISPVVIAALARLRELSISNAPCSSRPFDIDRDGFVLSEGSTILVLEAADCAWKRGARVYAEVRGHSSSADASDLFRVDIASVAAVDALEECLTDSGFASNEIDYICANANGSRAIDKKESMVLNEIFHERTVEIPTSSIKGIIGHPFGASGAFQAAATCLAISRHHIPPTHNTVNIDPECRIDPATAISRQREIRAALVSTYGFGGLNAYLVIGRAL